MGQYFKTDFVGSAVVQSVNCVSIVCNPMDCSTPDFPVLHYLLEFAQTHVQWVDDAIQPFLSVAPFFSCPPSFPASGSSPMSQFFAFSWPKYWSFSFNISPSNEYSGLTSFKIDWFDLLAVQETLKSLSPAPQFKSINSLTLSLVLTLVSVNWPQALKKPCPVPGTLLFAEWWDE